MPGAEKKMDSEEVIRNLSRQVDNAYSQLSHVQGELVFWKKLALHTLGVEKEKVNELVYQGFGAGSAPSALAPLRY